MAEANLTRPARTLLWLEHRANRPWFLPAVGVFPMCDYVFPFLPNQMLLAGLSMTLPQRWIALAATFVVATAAGATLLVTAIQQFGVHFIEQIFGGTPQASALEAALEQICTYGIPALIGLAMLPWPPRTAVIACAVAGLPPAQVGLAVLAGRIVPATLFARVGSKAPHLLRRSTRVDRIMREVEAAKRGFSIR